VAINTGYDHWYDRKVWKDIRRRHLAERPLCVMCESIGKIKEAFIVDHIKPHQGDWDLFLNEDNLQSLCKPHHDGVKRKEEQSNVIVGSTVDGRPRDPDHPWNKHRGA
jgi:5-methylcytosine-specific restriction protein A